MVPVRWIGEQHVKEDCGFIPSMQDWFQHIKPQRWMGEPPVKLERVLDKMDLDEEGTEEEKWDRHVGEKLVKK